MSRRSAKANAAKFGAIGFMAVALGCAALAAFLVGDMMRSSYSGTKVVPVVVAKKNLPAGTNINASLLEVVDWPENQVPAGSFATVEGLLKKHDGALPTVGILRGEPVVSARLSSSKTGTGMAALIRPNMRAIAMKVDDSVGFTSLVYPGAYVDVIATIRDPMGRGPSARTAVQNARVLSVGRDSDVATRKTRVQKVDRLSGNTQNGGTYLTLEVTPSEAEILAVAQREGRIDVVLRNATDDAVVETAGATPDKFSAFRKDDKAEDGTEPKKVSKSSKRRRVKVRRRNKRIQLVAHEGGDTPAPRTRKSKSSGTIETYNAN